MASRNVVILSAIIFFSILGLWVLQSYTPYQINCTPQSILTSSVEGVFSTENDMNLTKPYKRVWDSYDLAIPLEKDRLFLPTNIAIRDQHLGSCGEHHDVKGANCQTDSDCHENLNYQNGIGTGLCSNVIHENNSVNTCEITGWCPAGPPVFPYYGENVPILSGVRYFVLKLDNEVLFPDCEGIPSNIGLGGGNSENDCTYNEDSDPTCPNIRIQDLIKRAGGDLDIAFRFGGIFTLTIKWDCNFDDDFDNCRPQYVFKRISEDNHGKALYRTVRHNTVNIHANEHRTLTDYIGLKINIKVEGTFTKTNYTAFVFTLIAAITLLLFLFGSILGISYILFYAWVHGNRRETTQQAMEQRRVEEYPSVQCKQ